MLLISLLLVSLFTLSTGKSLSLDTQWESFKNIYKKSYSNPEEELYHKTIFAKNLVLIEQHNNEADKGKHTFRLGVTKFADLEIHSKSYSEDTIFYQSFNHENFKIMQQYPMDVDGRINIKLALFSELHWTEFKKNGPYMSFNDSKLQRIGFSNKKSQKSEVKLPESVDWRSKGIVTSVKDQRDCGSDWAFATAAAIESVYAQSTGQLLDLSVQNIVDCARKEDRDHGFGCDEGFAGSAFEYAKREGIVLEKCYPYVSKLPTDHFNCKINQTCSRVIISDYDSTNYDDEQEIAVAVSKRVVTVKLDAQSQHFRLYKGGIINTQNCSKLFPQHEVALVGYGTENGIDYWIFKNSWGSHWGENGFGRILRGNNTCGIATKGALFPTAKRLGVSYSRSFSDLFGI